MNNLNLFAKRSDTWLWSCFEFPKAHRPPNNWCSHALVKRDLWAQTLSGKFFRKFSEWVWGTETNSWLLFSIKNKLPIFDGSNRIEQAKLLFDSTRIRIYILDSIRLDLASNRIRFDVRKFDRSSRASWKSGAGPDPVLEKTILASARQKILW